MRTTIDRAGRLVIPKALRDQVGITEGEVEVTADGGSVRIQPASYAVLVEKDGLLMLPETGIAMSDDELREFRLADQR